MRIIPALFLTSGLGVASQLTALTGTTSIIVKKWPPATPSDFPSARFKIGNPSNGATFTTTDTTSVNVPTPQAWVVRAETEIRGADTTIYFSRPYASEAPLTETVTKVETVTKISTPDSEATPIPPTRTLVLPPKVTSVYVNAQSGPAWIDYIDYPYNTILTVVEAYCNGRINVILDDKEIGTTERATCQNRNDIPPTNVDGFEYAKSRGHSIGEFIIPAGRHVLSGTPRDAGVDGYGYPQGASLFWKLEKA